MPNATDAETRTLSVPVRRRRCGREIRILDGIDPFATAKPDVRLIKLLIRARRFNAALIGSGFVFDRATMLNMSRAFMPCATAVPGIGLATGNSRAFWQTDKPMKSETGHGTQKPVEWMKRPIE